MNVRSVYTFSCSEVRELLITCQDEDTRRGLLKMLDTFIEGATFIYTIKEADMKRLRKMEVAE